MSVAKGLLSLTCSEDLYFKLDLDMQVFFKNNIK